MSELKEKVLIAIMVGLVMLFIVCYSLCLFIAGYTLAAYVLH